MCKDRIVDMVFCLVSFVTVLISDVIISDKMPLQEGLLHALSDIKIKQGVPSNAH